MASGVEIAGLVLGSIPLILAGLQFYGEGIAITKRYRKYQQEVDTIFHELRAEQAIYTNSINILLFGVVDQRDMAELLKDPNGTRWKNNNYDTSLKKRLGSSYDSYMETSNRMLKITQIFNEKLKLDDYGKPQFTQQTAFKEHYKRLRFSLKKSDYAELMDKLRHANQTLYRLTNQATYIENHLLSPKQKRISIPNFRKIKSKAGSLHWAMGKGWRCPCQANHGIKLFLQDFSDNHLEEDSDSEDEMMKDPFRVLFCFDEHLTGKGSARMPDSWTWAQADVRIEYEVKVPTASVIAGPQHTKSVQFAKRKLQRAVDAALNPEQNLKPIQDLCSTMSALNKSQRDVVYSLLAQEIVKQRYGVHIYPAKQLPADSDSWSVSSLRNVLQSPEFPRQDRLKLAITLASSCLQLNDTPWLLNNWGKDHIMFIKSPSKILYDQPFVSHKIDQPSTTSLPSSMSRIIRNQYLYALGVALIELWYGKTLSELHRDDDGPKSTGNLTMDLMTEWNTADRVVDDLYSEAGGKYSDAVRRCIRCDFDHRASSLADAQFQKAVYEGVVTQLKENYEFLYQNNPP